LRWIKDMLARPSLAGAMSSAAHLLLTGLMAAMFAVASPVASRALAADFEAGCDAFEQGDFAAAVEQWRPLAKQGHAQAQYRVGCMHAYGLGVPQDHERALGLFRQAAEQGDADAQNNLGGMYALGWAVEIDLVEAYMWFALAAESGLEVAEGNRAFVAGMLSPQEIELALQRARDWAAHHP
jgi:TPR repeat protein